MNASFFDARSSTSCLSKYKRGAPNLTPLASCFVERERASRTKHDQSRNHNITSREHDVVDDSARNEEKRENALDINDDVVCFGDGIPFVGKSSVDTKSVRGAVVERDGGV